MVDVKFSVEIKQIKHKIIQWITGCNWEIIIYNDYAKWKLGLFKRWDDAENFKNILEKNITSQLT